MTGDGVNDAPSLRKADVGVAVSNATDIAKASASAVLTREGLLGMLDLVFVSRQIYSRVLTYILTKIIKAVLVTVFVAVIFLVEGAFALSAFHLVLLLVLTDLVTISLATDNVKPSPWPETWHIVNIGKASALKGLLVVGEALALFYLVCQRVPLSPEQQQTLAFEIIFFSCIWAEFVVRSRDYFFTTAPSRLLLCACANEVALVVALCSLGTPFWGHRNVPLLAVVPVRLTFAVLLATAALAFCVNDLIKTALFRRWKVRTN